MMPAMEMIEEAPESRPPTTTTKYHTDQVPGYNERASTDFHNPENLGKRMSNVYVYYNTTSTVMIEQTMSNPNHDKLILCIGAMLQAQMFEDSLVPQSVTVPELELLVQLPPELGGAVEAIPEFVLNVETFNDLELRQKIIDGVVPTVDTLCRFLSYISRRANYSTECNIIALVYINRITTYHRIPLTMRNWRGIWLGSIILAQKVWDDKPVKTSSFVTLLPTISKRELRDLEMKIFTLLDYNTTVKSSLYANYYFEMCALHSELVKGRSEMALKPLTTYQQQIMEYKTSKQAVVHSKPKSSATATALTGSVSTSSLSVDFSASGKVHSKVRKSPEIKLPEISLSSRMSASSLTSSSRTTTATTTPETSQLPRVGRNRHREPMPGNKTLEDLTIVDTSRWVIN